MILFEDRFFQEGGPCPLEKGESEGLFRREDPKAQLPRKNGSRLPWPIAKYSPREDSGVSRGILGKKRLSQERTELGVGGIRHIFWSNYPFSYQSRGLNGKASAKDVALEITRFQNRMLGF